jgi:hypothetical protein
MAETISFRKPKPSEKHAGETLCRSGFHKWKMDKQTVFDVKRGKLVMAYRCERCGVIKNQAR